jgi:hypothetical protein
MNIDYNVRNSVYRTGRIALRLRLNRARLTIDVIKALLETSTKLRLLAITCDNASDN